MEGRECEPLVCSEVRESHGCTTKKGRPQIAAGNATSARECAIELHSAFRGCSSGAEAAGGGLNLVIARLEVKENILSHLEFQILFSSSVSHIHCKWPPLSRLCC